MFWLLFGVGTFCVWGFLAMEYFGKFKGLGGERKKIIVVIALAAAASSLYQTWSNPFSASLWFSSSNQPLGVKDSNLTLAFDEEVALAPAPLYSDGNLSENVNTSSNSSTFAGEFQKNPADSGVVNRNNTGDNVVNHKNADGEMKKEVHESADLGPADKSGDSSMVKPSGKSRKRSFRSGDTKAFLERQQELKWAKKEIENAAGVVNDPDLYGPLFRNLSTFKKSYDLMEKIFKVYVYKEGPRPYFHQPELKGIYASEGWFMKIMDENKHFVVKDPRKAHMFYLPYSVYRLVEGMYDPNIHSMHPISLFLRDYVNMIASRYPFWNRTQGADHFFVACHDWGTYTTTKHPQLQKNAIKAVCNADLSEGYFVLGKDVSLPETTLHNVKHPTKNLGGKILSQRSILAFFAGNVHGRVRPVLLQYWKNKDEDMKIYNLLPSRVARKMSYAEHMKSSKYCICPMGFEVNSPRIVEAIYYECVPVIIADNFVPPLNEVLNWEAFSVIVAEKDIPKLKDILMNIPEKKYLSMQLRVRKIQKHFLWHRNPIKYDMFHMILHSIWFHRLNQIEQ